MSRRFLFIRNPASSGGRNQDIRLARIVAALESAGFTATVKTTSGRGSATELASQYGMTFDAVIAAGGDGTVRETAAGLIRSGSRAVLGILPLGTGNDVARLVGTATVAEFLETVRHGDTDVMDTLRISVSRPDGTLATHTGLLFGAVGFAGELLRQTTPRVVRWFGPRWCYSVGFLRAVASYQPPQVTVRSGGRSESGPLLLACAANAPHAGGGAMQLAPGARLADGRLNMSIIRQVGRLGALRQFPALLRGTHLKDPRVIYFEAEDMTVETDRPVPVAIDGDLLGTTPARFEIAHRSLRILTRRRFQD